jgi:hypothetical protein
LTSYLNIVFILLLVIEIFSLGSQAIFKKKAAPESFAGFTSICDTCQKPDIYIILLDGYAGAEQLNDIFHYDNSPFSDSLKLRGFKVVKKSNSNYDSSPSSVASTLNMEYLDSAEVENMRKNGHRDAFTRINNNRLMSFLQANGYDVFNYSIFKVAGQAAPIGGAFVPANTRLVNGNTLVSRLEKDVFLNLATRFHLDSYVKKQLYAANRDNERLTQKNVMTRSSRPKIIYTHLMMPHHPYYYDENGKARPFEELNNMPLNDTVAYLSYLKYTNKKILELVDHILSNSPSPPVITVMSDHGFRYFNGEYNKYAFSDFLSIHTPGRNYDQFSDTMTNVNFFSRLLNNSFQQQLPLQIDTSFKVDF